MPLECYAQEMPLVFCKVWVIFGVGVIRELELEIGKLLIDVEI